VALRALRSVLALASPVLGYLTSIVGSVLGASALRHLCPQELLVSGMCTARWYASAELALIAAFVALGASLFVALPVVFAPSHKRWVALVAYAAGAIFVSVFTWQVGLSFWPPYAAALASGGATAAIAYVRYKSAG
jgi:hypothetical protein